MYLRFIFQFFWKIRKKKTKVTLSPILRFNLRLGGYSIWSASTSGLEHLTASKQSEVFGGLLDIPGGRLRSSRKDAQTI